MRLVDFVGDLKLFSHKADLFRDLSSHNALDPQFWHIEELSVHICHKGLLCCHFVAFPEVKREVSAHVFELIL